MPAAAQEATLPQRTAEVVKEAHQLLNESRNVIDNAEKKIAAFEADGKAASAVCDEAFQKLCSVSHNGHALVPEESRVEWREALKTKEGMATLISELVGVVENRQEAESKSAGELGGAADESAMRGQQQPTVTGFAGLSSTVRM